MFIKRKKFFKIVCAGAFLDKPIIGNYDVFVLCKYIVLEILQFTDFLDIFDLLSPKIIL
jgi:hypothetical protein